jgi:hypothetical protein
MKGKRRKAIRLRIASPGQVRLRIASPGQVRLRPENFRDYSVTKGRIFSLRHLMIPFNKRDTPSPASAVQVSRDSLHNLTSLKRNNPASHSFAGTGPSSSRKLSGLRRDLRKNLAFDFFALQSSQASVKSRSGS